MFMTSAVNTTINCQASYVGAIFTIKTRHTHLEIVPSGNICRAFDVNEMIQSVSLVVTCACKACYSLDVHTVGMQLKQLTAIVQAVLLNSKLTVYLAVGC